MKHSKFKILVILVVFSLPALGQQIEIDNYFAKLTDILKNDSTISEVEFIHKNYNNGNPELRMMVVKLKKDSIPDRFICIGKGYTFFKNGELAMYQNVNLNSKTLIDTLYNYEKDGCIKSMWVFDNTTPLAYSAKFGIRLRKTNYFVNFPAKYSVYEFKNCKKAKEYSYTFQGKGYSMDLEDNFEFRINPELILNEDNQLAPTKDSIVSYYNFNSKLDKIVYFRNGNEYESCVYDYGGLFNSKITYREGLMHGLWENSFKDGRIKERRYYYLGEPTGIWEIYSKNGILIAETNFEHDIVIRKTYQYTKKKKKILIEKFQKDTEKLIGREKVEEPLK